MDGMVLPILVAATGAAAAWGVAQAALAIVNGDRRKLARRLSQDGRPAAANPLAVSITVQPIESAGFSRLLARLRPLRPVHRMLVQAWPDLSLAGFLGIVSACGAGTFLVFAALGSLVVAAGVGACAAYVPFVVLQARRNRRQRQLALQLPEALDFLSRVLRAGHSLSTGLQMLGEELPRPLSDEFRRAYNQHTLGQALDAALKDMAARIESTDFAFFVTAVLIQRQTGGDLSEVLDNISGMVRQRIRLQQHVKARTAEGRFTGNVLVAFPAVMFLVVYVLNPHHMDIMLTDSTGMGLLGAAVGLQLLGLWSIRKITTVKV